jgi:hypothetical protein
MRRVLWLCAVALALPAQAQVPEGVALEWISDSSFRFCRAWGEEKCPPVTEPVSVTKAESQSHVRQATKYLVVEIDKSDGRLRVLDSKGKDLMVEAAPASQSGQVITVERVAAPGERFYGLGARTDARADARGQIVESSTPFLISSQGYGLHHVSAGSYVFDLGRSVPDRYRITLSAGRKFEYCFYYGLEIKAIFDEHLRVVTPRGYSRFGLLSRAALPRTATPLPAASPATWGTLEGAVHSLVHASLSGMLNPAFDVAPYRAGPPALFRRAMHLASIVPLVFDSLGAPLEEERRRIQESALAWRERMVPFFRAYVEETTDRGYPLIHPLQMQYPNDAEASNIADEFMIGDEILFAPVYTEGNRRSVYLPMGRWTELATNKEYPGRQRIEVEVKPDEMALFLKNGSIVPLDSSDGADPMVLHYMPKLAGEFFLFEPELAEYTQLHAAPALDLMRLEIESKVARTYEWIIHHTAPAREVKTGATTYRRVKDGNELRPGTWYYDRELQNMHIRVRVGARETGLTHVAF